VGSTRINLLPRLGVGGNGSPFVTVLSGHFLLVGPMI